MNAIAAGAVAGAVGTTVLNAATYVDVAVRGREPSSVPNEVAGKVADAAGVDLGDKDTAPNRRTGVGALFGYATGVAVGVGLATVRSRVRVPVLVGALAAGAGAMASADVTATALGVTDPREWGASGWAADLVPHLLFGLATAATLDRIIDR